jgi:hypothetical protein
VGYAIICDSRKGGGIGIDTLALVDRKLTKSTWWTSDDTGKILNYRKLSAADFACKRLRKNHARVVDYKDACRIISEQANEIIHHEAMSSIEEGWDGHKF